MVEKLIPRFIKCRKSFSNDEYTIGTMLIQFQDTNLPEIEKKYFNQIKIYFKTSIISLDNDKFIYSYDVIKNKLHLQQIYCKPEQIVPIKHILSDLFEFTPSQLQSEIADCKDCMCQRHLTDACVWMTIRNPIIKTSFYNYIKGDVVDEEIIVCASSSLLFIKNDTFGLYLDTKQDQDGDICSALMKCGLYYDVADKIIHNNRPKYIEQNLYANFIKDEINFNSVWFHNYFQIPILNQTMFEKCDINLDTSRIQFTLNDKVYLSSIFIHVGDKL